MIKENFTKDLTIIIVTYNSAQIIEQCLNKLNFEKYDVVVVDNQSSDQTVNLVKNNFPQAKIIKSEKNIGYGRANNLALRKTKTDFVLILNTDAFIFENEIEKILELMKSQEKIALAAPLLLNSDPDLKQENPDQEIQKQLAIAKSNLIEENNSYLSVKYLIGAVLFMKMSVFRKIGFFDEDIFLYYEDDEISHRAIKNGYEAIILKDCYAYHLSHKSSGSSLRSLYKRSFHKALSKFYWKQKLKGRFASYKSAARFLIFHFLGSIFYLLTFNFRNFIDNLGSTCGSFSFLIGLSAFKKNGDSRG